MYKSFLIQTQNKEIVHDFSFQLRESIKYTNWKNKNDLTFGYPEYKIIYSHEYNPQIHNDTDNIFPVGSLEFVVDFINTNYGTNPKHFKPINVPTQLQQNYFLKRNIVISDSATTAEKFCDEYGFEHEELFVKSNSRYKYFCDIVKPFQNLPKDDYLISEIKDIASEYRCFVFDNELINIKHYSGDYKKFPDVLFIEHCIQEYAKEKNKPRAYTLDIGIDEKRLNFVIEVHPMVSCGFYGWSDYQYILPSVMSGYKWFKDDAIQRLKGELI